MLGPFHGETVTVIRDQVTYDDLGEPTYGEPEREQVSDVLVQPGSTADLDATRPNGVEVAFTLHFPKTYAKSLQACRVEVREKSYEVVGDPQPYTASNTPGDWNLPVEVKRVDG